LKTNFRSYPAIIDAVNRVFGAPGVFRDEGTRDATSSYHPAYAPLEPPPDSPDDVGDTPRRILRVTDGRDGEKVNADERRAREATVIAATIRQAVDEGWPVRDPITAAVRPLQYGDVAILYRTTTGIALLETALQNASVPYYQIGGKDFYRREEIARLVSVLSAIEQPNDALSVVAALRSPFFGVSDTDLLRTKPNFDYRNAPLELPGTVRHAYEILRELHAMRRESHPSALLQRLYERTKVLGVFALSKNGDQAIANLLKILDDARRVEAIEPVSFRRFNDRLRRMREDGVTEGEAEFTAHDDTGSGRVHLLTIHKAKGLEFPVVCVFDLAAGKGRGTSSPVDLHTIRDADHERPRVGLQISGDSIHLSAPGFLQFADENAAREDAESKRLLYVALTRARDYLLLPTIVSKTSSNWERIIDDALPANAQTAFTPHEAPPTGDTSSARIDTTTEELDAIRSAFETARRELYERAVKPRVQFRRPSMHGDERASHKDVESDEARTRDEAQRLGTVVHAAMEHVVMKRDACTDDQISTLIDELADEHGLYSTGLRNDAAALTRRGLRVDVVRRARAAKRAWTEVPVMLCEPDVSGDGIS
ncbi:MAG TPA: hypothetical protein ENN56_01120, partial [Firmicutes bacterium]|nr:hypothetical protein [Bacillota bacterium]